MPGRVERCFLCVLADPGTGEADRGLEAPCGTEAARLSGRGEARAVDRPRSAALAEDVRALVAPGDPRAADGPVFVRKLSAAAQPNPEGGDAGDEQVMVRYAPQVWLPLPEYVNEVLPVRPMGDLSTPSPAPSSGGHRASGVFDVFSDAFQIVPP